MIGPATRAVLEGPAFSLAILSLYALRCVTYLTGGHLGRAAYWLSAFLITLSVEFLIKRWP